MNSEQIEAAAKTLAACMDYPWEHMPERGRNNMRKHAKAVIEASGIAVLTSAPAVPEAARMCECGVLPHGHHCSWAYPDEPKGVQPGERGEGCGNGKSEAERAPDCVNQCQRPEGAICTRGCKIGAETRGGS